MEKELFKSLIRKCIWNQKLFLIEQTDVNLRKLDKYMDYAQRNGFGQDYPPDGLKQNIKGSLSYSTETLQDLTGNIWYHKNSEFGDFWILKDDFLTAIQGL